MSSRCLRLWTAFAAAALLCLPACEREKRQFDSPSPPPTPASAPMMRATPLQPGNAQLGASSVPTAHMPSTDYRYENNAFAVSQGKRLYRWYNCSSCHAPGGGGDWGPALSDDQWVYGSSPANIFASIAEGRPAGMPSFAAHISEDQTWQLVAYVRSLSGQLPKDVAPGRSDTMSGREPEAGRDRERPKPMEKSDGNKR
jgi:cytochrome c oxidase cbb3-type subunit 3